MTTVDVDAMCRCGHPLSLHARVDHRDNHITYPCRQVLPLDSLDGRVRAEPPQCQCANFRAELRGIWNGAMS